MKRIELFGGRPSIVYTSASELGGFRQTLIDVLHHTTIEHERDIYTGIELAWLLQPGRRKWPIEWRRVVRDRIRDRADGPQNPTVGPGGRLRYPVF